MTTTNAILLEPKKQTIHLKLASLRGTVAIDDIIREGLHPVAPYSMQARGLTVEQPPPGGGPPHLEDLPALRSIHIAIRSVFDNPSPLAWRVRHWLTLVFLHVFRIYGLDREGWGCRATWLHLQRLRFHSIMRLWNSDRENAEDALRMGLRDWLASCEDPSTHFLFTAAQGLKGPEEEILSAISGEEEMDRRSPRRVAAWFLETERGQRELERLISEWFLLRFQWSTAFRIAVAAAPSKFRAIRSWVAHALGLERPPGRLIHWPSVFLFATVGSIIVLGYATVGPAFIATNASIILLASMYCALTGISMLGLFWRTVFDLLLPRLWVGITVGYVPLMLTAEAWEAVYGCSGFAGCTVQSPSAWKLGLMNVIVLAVCFQYYLWFEVDKGLRSLPTRTYGKVARSLSE